MTIISNINIKQSNDLLNVMIKDSLVIKLLLTQNNIFGVFLKYLFLYLKITINHSFLKYVMEIIKV